MHVRKRSSAVQGGSTGIDADSALTILSPTTMSNRGTGERWKKSRYERGIGSDILRFEESEGDPRAQGTTGKKEVKNFPIAKRAFAVTGEGTGK